MKVLARALACLGLLFWAVSPAFAQFDTATVLGTVRDNQGGVVPGAMSCSGPSGDGGFYLAGLRRGTPFDWSSIPWCSRDTSLAFCASAVDAGLIVHIVERLDDWRAAIAPYQEAARLAPAQAQVRTGLARAMVEANDPVLLGSPLTLTVQP